MKYFPLIFIALIAISSNLIAQDRYVGQFSKYVTYAESDTKMPVGKHSSYDVDEQLKIKIEYGKKGWIKNINIEDGQNVISLLMPDTFEELEWELITDGIWINKTAEKNPSKIAFDGEQRVNVHYAGFLLDGNPFDNSFVRNKPLKGLSRFFIKGFSIGHENIQTGELRLIKISPENAYGTKGATNIPPNSTLVYFIYKIESKS